MGSLWPRLKNMGLALLMIGILFVWYREIPKILEPDWWFNDTVHIAGGILAAWLSGAFWELISGRSFVAAHWFAKMLVTFSGAVVCGVLVEIFEYHYWWADVLKEFTDFLLYHDTMLDLEMGVVGGLVGAFWYALIRSFRRVNPTHNLYKTP